MPTKNEYVYYVWSEYDIGLSETVFANSSVAWKKAEEAWDRVNDTGESFRDLRDGGLVTVEPWELVNE